MRYEHYEDLAGLKEAKLISVRPHPTLPLFIYNYTAAAQSLPIREWSPALQQCRGLILDHDGEVIGRPFPKFWNYEQVLDQIPSDLPFTVWEKVDGSLGIVCNYRGSLVVATRGSFESEQAKFAEEWLDTYAPLWVPAEGLTYLYEIIFPANRIVVDYGNTSELRLLAVIEQGGWDCPAAFYSENRFPKAKSFAPRHVFDPVTGDMRVQEMDGEEGYVVRWSNGFRAKVKFEEYKRLHRLITQVSTRTIWEMLRAGEGPKIKEFTDRVPEAFQSWVYDTVNELIKGFNDLWAQAEGCFERRPLVTNRADYAAWVKTQPANFGLLFALYDGKPIEDKLWKMVEPKWTTPFRPKGEEE